MRLVLAAAVAVGLGSAAAAQPPAETLSSFQARFVAHIMKADANHDGRVSLAEWLAFRASHPTPNHPNDPRKIFDKIDRNRDGYLTPDEVAAFSVIAYQRRTEANAAPPPPHR